MSVPALAESVGLSSRWLEQIEYGSVEARWGSLRDLARELGVTLAALIEEGERMEPTPAAGEPGPVG